VPTELHLALQRHYAGETGLIEAELDGYRADVLRDGVIYEIQTASLSSIRRKLQDLSRRHRVVLVVPLAAEEVIVRVDPQSGEELSARRSPRRARVTDIFEELLYLAPLLRRDNLALEVVMTVQRELRRDDGAGSWRRKGVSVIGHELVEIVATHRFKRPADFLDLLPPELPARFTVADLARAAEVRRWMAGRMAYGLRKLGAIRKVGKRGNAFVYRRAAERRAPGGGG